MDMVKINAQGSWYVENVGRMILITQSSHAQMKQIALIVNRDCEVWKKEKEILKIKHTKKISFSEARRSIEANFNAPSYAKITQAIPSYTNENLMSNKLHEKQELASLIQELKNILKILKPILNLQTTSTTEPKVTTNNVNPTQNSLTATHQLQDTQNFVNEKFYKQKTDKTKTNQIPIQDKIETQKTEETELKTNKQNKPHKDNQGKKQNGKNLNNQEHTNTRRRTSSQTRKTNNIGDMEYMEIDNQKHSHP